MDEILARAGIFQGVDPGAVAALTKQLQPADFPRGHTVFAEGEPGDRLYIIISGKVKIGRRRMGSVEILAGLKEGDVVNSIDGKSVIIGFDQTLRCQCLVQGFGEGIAQLAEHPGRQLFDEQFNQKGLRTHVLQAAIARNTTTVQQPHTADQWY